MRCGAAFALVSDLLRKEQNSKMEAQGVNGVHLAERDPKVGVQCPVTRGAGGLQSGVLGEESFHVNMVHVSTPA